MTGARIAVPLGLGGEHWRSPRSRSRHAPLTPDSLLSARDDPVALADRAVARSFDAAVAAREIDARACRQ